MALGPIDYSIDMGSPFASALQGFQVGDALQQRQLAQQKAAAKAQADASAQAAMKQDLSALAGNRNASGSDYASVIAKYPQLSEQLKRGWDVKNMAQQQEELAQVTPVFAALQNNKPDIAIQTLSEQAAAARNSGDEQGARAAETLAKLIEQAPEAAKTSVTLRLAATAGPEKLTEALNKLGIEQRAVAQAPADLRTAEAKAKQEEVKAKYADSTALQEAEKRGWDIKKVISDINIDKENARINAMNAALNREANGLKRQELQLKIDDAKTAREEKIRDKVSGAESAASTIDNMLNTADRVLKNPALNSVLGSVQGRLPAVLSDDASDAIELIDTLGSQSFLSQLPSMKGLGALSEKEGEKLQSALTNLSRKQSEQQFRYNLGEAQRLMLKARENLTKKTGVPLPAPDRPNAPARVESAQPGATAPAQPQKNITVDF